MIPVFLHDSLVAGQGAAARFRLGLAVDDLAAGLAQVGSRLTLRRGDALTCLRDLIAETGASAVYWSRLYDPVSKARDVAVKAALTAMGITARSFPGHLLIEPWMVETQTGGYYRVFTPLWKAVRGKVLGECLPAPGRIQAPAEWPVSDALAHWGMAAAMRRGADVLRPHCVVGEIAARDRLAGFVNDRIATYATDRDRPGVDGTSGLSENLACGEISPLACWHAGWRALQSGKADAEVFLKELVWREFAYHLAHHTPHIVDANWKPEWDTFPWNADPHRPEVLAWKQGRTGVPFVDAAMRQMYVTGTMHNRGRMIVASYLTKHLMTHWRIGLDWFADCLTDWDPASNAMGWQWTAGSGPDASPYFRIFNPVTQLEKFDPAGAYARRWIAEAQKAPPQSALSYFDAVPRSWALSPSDVYPKPIVGLEEGRNRALAAYQSRGL